MVRSTQMSHRKNTTPSTVTGTDELAAAIAEIARLRAENDALRQGLEGRVASAHPQPTAATVARDAAACRTTQHSPEADKIALFRRLFAGRTDVFAQRWERPDGRSGYSPAYRRPAYGALGSLDRDAREYLPLTDDVIRAHLIGERTIGVYPLLRDERCWFVAADFDKAGWIEDARAFMAAATMLGVPAVLERSRSGAGGHVWTFFAKPVTAAQARALASSILTRALERRHTVGMDSYDRLFPNQDVMPKGGFGNLIALPLQRRARRDSNTVFVDPDTLTPFEDQWAFLATVERLAPEDVAARVREATRRGLVLAVPRLALGADEEDPWVHPVAVRRPKTPIDAPLPARAQIVESNLVYIAKAGLPSELLHRLARLAAFPNPAFYEAQALRLSTYGKPRIIDCSEDHPRHLALPRGCLDDVLELLGRHGVFVEREDEREHGSALDLRFSGTLTALQRRAAAALTRHETGVLAAPTAFGKTVIAASLIASRRTNTLVLVHRRMLLDQWRERLAAFLDVDAGAIGEMGGGRRRLTHTLDIAVLQSVIRHGEVVREILGYGQVIVDECHHIPAFSFERVLRTTKARYVLGLTATPVRKDGHHPIIVMQCGRIRHRVAIDQLSEAQPFDHRVLPVATSFTADSEGGSIQALYASIATCGERTRQICDAVVSAVTMGRSPLVLTERTDHLRALHECLSAHGVTVVVLRGGMGARQRRAAIEMLQADGASAPRVILATGRYIGEGFDDARLDTLFLAMPVAWRGTIQQYAGRLHRSHADKESVLIHDYVDVGVPVLERMFERRLRGYRAMGYQVDLLRTPAPDDPRHAPDEASDVGRSHVAEHRHSGASSAARGAAQT